MKTKHTPGPWTLAKKRGYNGTFMVECETYAPGCKGTVALVSYKPDAALIAAAPKMLEFIKRMNHAFYVEGTPKAMKPVMAESKALIADAEGRT